MDVGDDSVSLIYRDEYNIHLLGMEKLHPFDACKWGNVVKVIIFLKRTVQSLKVDRLHFCVHVHMHVCLCGHRSTF